MSSHVHTCNNIIMYMYLDRSLRLDHHLEYSPCQQHRSMIHHVSPFQYQRVQFLNRKILFQLSNHTHSNDTHSVFCLEVLVHHDVVTQPSKTYQRPLTTPTSKPRPLLHTGIFQVLPGYREDTPNPWLPPVGGNIGA